MQSIAQPKVYGNTFDERHLTRLWKEVKQDPWGDLRREHQEFIKRLLQGSMEEEVSDLIGSSPWQHNYNRTDYRNGYYYL